MFSNKKTEGADDDSDWDYQLNGSSQYRRTNISDTRVRKLRSTTNRPSPPLPYQNNKRKRLHVRTHSSSESDPNIHQTYKTRTRSGRHVKTNKKSSLVDDFSNEEEDEEDENRRRPQTTQATRVSKHGRILKQRLLSE